jgi:hypothetical protein
MSFSDWTREELESAIQGAAQFDRAAKTRGSFVAALREHIEAALANSRETQRGIQNIHEPAGQKTNIREQVVQELLTGFLRPGFGLTVMLEGLERARR